MIGVLGVLPVAADAASGWTAFVTEQGTNVVTQISTASNTMFGTAIPVGTKPSGVAITRMAALPTSPTTGATR